MADIVSPTLQISIAHAQINGTDNDVVPVNFQLASDEAVELIQMSWNYGQGFPFGGDALYVAALSLDPDRAALTRAAAGTYTPIEWENASNLMTFVSVRDLVTSGIAEGMIQGGVHNFPPGIVTAQNMTAVFATNNVGAVHVMRIVFRILRITDREFVQLVARRRAGLAG